MEENPLEQYKGGFVKGVDNELADDDGYKVVILDKYGLPTKQYLFQKVFGRAYAYSPTDSRNRYGRDFIKSNLHSVFGNKNAYFIPLTLVDTIEPDKHDSDTYGKINTKGTRFYQLPLSEPKPKNTQPSRLRKVAESAAKLVRETRGSLGFGGRGHKASKRRKSRRNKRRSRKTHKR